MPTLRRRNMLNFLFFSKKKIEKKSFPCLASAVVYSDSANARTKQDVLKKLADGFFVTKKKP